MRDIPCTEASNKEIIQFYMYNIQFYYFIYVYALLLLLILLNVIIIPNVLLNCRITRDIRECSYYFDCLYQFYIYTFI